MIDLHLHLDGSLPPALVFALAKEQGIPLPPDAQDAESLTPSLVCPPGCTSLNDYLTRFALPVAVMQTESAIMRCVQGVLAELKSEGVLYAELRFAPGQHCQQGLSQENVVAAACRALAEGCRTLGIQAQLILCCMRGAPDAQNAETLRLAREYLGKGVCAADLAGAEALFPTRSYAPLFAAVPGLPFTIHAGEADGPESIRAALAMGAKRIGHGVRCIEDAALVAEQPANLHLCRLGASPAENAAEGRRKGDREQRQPHRERHDRPKRNGTGRTAFGAERCTASPALAERRRCRLFAQGPKAGAAGRRAGAPCGLKPGALLCAAFMLYYAL